MASSAGPAQTCGRLRPEVPKPRLNSGPVGGERRSGRRRPPSQASAPVWCNKEAEANLIAGRSAAHGPCREPHPSPVSGGRRADPLSYRQMRILSIGLVGWPRQTCGRLRPEVPKPRLNSGTVGGERRSARHRPPSQASAPGSGHWRPPWRCGRLCAAVWRVCGRGGGIARRGPAVGVEVSGSCPPGVVPPVQASRPTAPPARPYYAVVRRTRRRGGVVRGAAVRVGWGRPPRGVACACCAREATSWSPAPSSSCSWMMLSRSKMARRLWPVRRMATRSGTLAPPRRPGPAPLGSPASDVARRPRSAGQLSRHGITARPVASVAE